MSPQDNAGGPPSPVPPPKGGIIVSASKKRPPTGLGGGGLGVIRKSESTPAASKRRPPTQPKVPFESEALLPTTPQQSVRLSRHKPHHHRGFFAGFRSRRKGRQRVVAFILLPLAVLATVVFIVWLLG